MTQICSKNMFSSKFLSGVRNFYHISNMEKKSFFSFFSNFWFGLFWFIIGLGRNFWRYENTLDTSLTYFHFIKKYILEPKLWCFENSKFHFQIFFFGPDTNLAKIMQKFLRTPKILQIVLWIFLGLKKWKKTFFNIFYEN